MPDKAAWSRTKFASIFVFNYAVGNGKGTIPFYVNKSRGGYSLMIRPSPGSDDVWEKIKVKIDKLDNIITGKIYSI